MAEKSEATLLKLSSIIMTNELIVALLVIGSPLGISRIKEYNRLLLLLSEALLLLATTVIRSTLNSSGLHKHLAE
ncbi:MAG: hypothetical protein F6K22_10880 [Okeania sp. SIO2F4]|uniref:hypothetical protein n=1 Tax=Okeania sp. SIO2F4 TaxID=2607790 RepID=UPI0014299BB8|nr:hypothetical protein [Okeania sp. SIO2F4]NES03306.1 hypothetical protein [Okeania sp. SIO2F4]